MITATASSIRFPRSRKSLSPVSVLLTMVRVPYSLAAALRMSAAVPRGH
jgi:hypothetical protein